MQVYLVGGAVRDALLGRDIKERDYVVVGATPEQLISQGYQQVGKDFPVFLHPQSKEEYALARTERKQGQGYNGFICDFAPDVTLEQDLIRRDLTVNAIAQAEDGSLIDPFSGQQDLENRLLRHVSDAFSEDPLRILRVARFAARYHYLSFTIAPETKALLIDMVKAGELNTLTAERVWLECEKSLSDGAFSEFLNVLASIGGLHVVSAELEEKWCDELYNTLQARFAYANKLQINDIAVLFSQVTLSLSSDEINTIATSIRLPNEVRDLALFSQIHQTTLSAEKPTSEAIFSSFNQLDLWRRPERFEQVLKVLEVSHQQSVACYESIIKAAAQARAVNPQQFIAQGIKGAEIKTALEQARLEVIKNYFS
ncbi:tRNA nucleotidyltransferase [Pseudoalteromonas shioyasakiensis]|uniref:tRNA nucleotidyltransferase n=1 Tax=Pseudoalteromonas shioyasakiensis TaxID=1190813 RepID=UPI00211829A9|nr:tRNA nucleotidyltransferase [Pseudoalteromonas shioyasakiensis]MCQ8881070.1 tRNA nucleotidyltransferase [Pseudoalteromonas shioyasakiensis]